MTKIDTGWTPVDQLVGAVCMQCEIDIPKILHCQWRCANQEDIVIDGEFCRIVTCDCDCAFPNQGMAEQMAYEMMYDL